MNKLLVFTFIVLTGTNTANYYTTAGPYFAALVLLMFTWFAFQCFFSKKTLQASIRLIEGQSLFWAIFFSWPMLLMWFSDREFERGDWTNQITVLAVYIIGALIWFDTRLRQAIVLGALTVALTGAFLNIYEFFITNNLWSTAPGRSAGLYVNPNSSAAAISIYAIIYFALRESSFAKLDWVILAALLVGILVTFSRGGYVLFLMAVASALVKGSVLQATRKRFKVGTAVTFLAALTVFAWLFVDNVLLQTKLSEDASSRLESLASTSIEENYSRNRGVGAQAGWSLALQSPWAGMGVRTSLEMKPQGPHNMFVGIAMDFGMLGLVCYVALILGVLWRTWTQRASERSNEMLLASIGMAWLVLHGFASHNILYSAFDVLALSFAINASAGYVMPRVRQRRFVLQ